MQCLLDGELPEGRKAVSGLRYRFRIPLLHIKIWCSCDTSCYVAVLHNLEVFLFLKFVNQKGAPIMKNATYVRRITISAVFLSISLVLKTAFSFYIPMFGQNGMSVGISGIFSMLPALLFGPVYGAAVSGLTDLLGYVLKPTGPYIPLMTLTAAAGGFLRGVLWNILRNKNSKNIRLAVGGFALLLLLLGICNIAFLSADGIDSTFYERIQADDIDMDNLHAVSRLLITRTVNTKDPAKNLATYSTFVTSGVIGSAALGLLLLAADFIISRKFLKNPRKAQVPQLLITLVCTGLIITTINTVILRETAYEAWKLLPFSVLWIPRAIEEILGNTVKAYFIAMLLGLFQKLLTHFSE